MCGFMQAHCQGHKGFASLDGCIHTGGMKAQATSVKKKGMDVVILLVLVGIAGFQIYLRFGGTSGEDPLSEEDALLLQGLEPEPTPIPGRSVMGGKNHEMLTEAVAGMNEQLSELELMGLIPGTEATPKPEQDPQPDPDAAGTEPANPEPDAPKVLPGAEPESEPESEPEAEPSAEPEPPAVPEPEPTPSVGIWVRTSRQGDNPIRVEDHVSVDEHQLSEMAGFRNISTDRRFEPPNFVIAGFGKGRLGTYVIVNNQMIRLNGQINSPTEEPRAWRLVDATPSEVLWEPVMD